MLNKLKSINEFPVYSCRDKEFLNYGNVLEGYDFEELVEYADKNTKVPETGNIYVGSAEEMEKLESLYQNLQDNFYGGMEPQIGYCNGNNSFLNGLEYHKGSEINVAVTDLVLLLGKTTEMENGLLDSSKVKAFYVPKGQAVEVYQTSMHFAPCKVNDSGFKCIVILPKGTNEDIDLSSKQVITEEDKYLFKKNKWLLVHEDKQDLIAKGAHHGITGENIRVKY